MASSYAEENLMSLPLRIAVFGPESTGKTRLAEILATHFDSPLVAEYAREFWDAHGAISLGDIPAIAREQWRREDEAVAGLVDNFNVTGERGLLICDTESLTTALWSEVLYLTCPSDVRREAEKRAKAYTLYLLLDVDVPFEEDPQRCFPDDTGRKMCFRVWRGTLDRLNLPYVLITGDWRERERQAIGAVGGLNRK